MIGVPGASVIARVMGMLLVALTVSMVLGALGELAEPAEALGGCRSSRERGRPLVAAGFG